MLLEVCVCLIHRRKLWLLPIVLGLAPAAVYFRWIHPWIGTAWRDRYRPPGEDPTRF